MSDRSMPCVVHVLSLRPRGDAMEARATVRSGDPQPGRRFWFASKPDGVRREILLAALEAGKRHLTLRLEGEDVRYLQGGAYLYGDGQASDG